MSRVLLTLNPVSGMITPGESPVEQSETATNNCLAVDQSGTTNIYQENSRQNVQKEQSHSENHSLDQSYRALRPYIGSETGCKRGRCVRFSALVEDLGVIGDAVWGPDVAMAVQSPALIACTRGRTRRCSVWLLEHACV